MPKARIAALTSVLLVIGLVTACGSRDGRATKPVHDSPETAQGNRAEQDGVGTVPIGTPCPGAVHGDPMTIAAASRASVYLPADGRDQITDAWRCARTPVFMFGHIALSFESGWNDVDIPAKFQDLADDYGGSVQEIQGLDAWVVASAPGDEVLIVKDGDAIRLLATGDVRINELVALAERLDLRKAVNR